VSALLFRGGGCENLATYNTSWMLGGGVCAKRCVSIAILAFGGWPEGWFKE